MTVSGVDSTSANSGVFKTDGVSVAKRLQEANKTVLDAKANLTNENDLQELVEDDALDGTAGKTGEKSDSVKEMDERVLRYYEQIDALRKQLDDVNKQRRVLVEKMQSGTSTEELMSELTTLNGQSRSINNNINMVFASIMQLEQSIESENLSNIQSGIGVSKTASLNGTSAAASVSPGLSSNAKVDTQTGKKLAEAVVSCINTNGSTKGWCLRGVNKAMQKVYGYGFSFGSAYQALGALQKDSNFVEITSQYPNKTDLKNLPAGAIVVWGKNGAHPHGHISIALGDGREASDHIANQYTNSGGGYHIFMPKEKE